MSKAKRFARDISLRRVALHNQHIRCPLKTSSPTNYYQLVEAAEAERRMRPTSCGMADSELYSLLYDLVTLKDEARIAHMLQLLVSTVPNWRGRLAWEAVRFNNLLMLELALHACAVVHPEYHRRWLEDLLDLAICQDRPEHAELLLQRL